MQKLGIITFNRALNYGAVLQAYALKKACSGLGFETHIVDYNKQPDIYRNPFEIFGKSPKNSKTIIKLLKGILSYHWNQKRRDSFVLFRGKYLNESTWCKDPDSVSMLSYDAYIVGSDQIWNYYITGGKFDPVYFGNHPCINRSIIYGASAHDTPFPLNMELELKKMLLQSNAPIGIREQKLADYCGELTGIRYPVVLDPTLLAGRSVFDEICSNRPCEDNYILLYQIDSNPLSDISIRTLEKRFKCKVYSMTVPKIGSLRGKKGDVGPEAFIALLKHAKFIVTNSFHGVALSVLFHKLFYVYDNADVMDRIDGLMESLSINGRKVRLVSDIDLDKGIEYASVDEKLRKLREESLVFLKRALDGDRQISEYHHRGNLLKSFLNREKKDCSGCTACVEVCPVGAIKMERDEEGFFYPKVDNNICVHCNKCDSFCSFKSCRRRDISDLPKAYGVKHKQIQERRTSRSGGAFIALSDSVLRENGVVYGAVTGENGYVYHLRAENACERDFMKGAKYVQSDINGVFSKIIDDLSSDRKVLFSGTPCQVMGLLTLLDYKGINRDNLLTCDLVCHGVPSPQIWENYYSLIQARYKRKIVKADFRDKSLGWDTHCESFVLDNGKKIISRDYTDLFYDHIIFRPSCHNCRFSNINRPGDITLADFWGIENSDPSFEDNAGVSLVLLNTEKGEKAFCNSNQDMDYIKCDIRRCLQPTLVKPSKPSPRRELFWKSYYEKGFEKTLKEFVKPVSAYKRTRRVVKNLLYHMKLRQHP